jgi:hypothetical protein
LRAAVIAVCESPAAMGISIISSMVDAGLLAASFAD